jgi:hypothetical protein
VTYLSRSWSRRLLQVTSVALDIVEHTLLVVDHSYDDITGGVEPVSRMNNPRDQGQRLGGTSHSSNYQHGTTPLSTSPIEKSRFRRFETSNQQQQQRSNHNVQPIGPYSAPLTGPSRLPDRTHAPTRASTVDSTDYLRNKMASHSDYGHQSRSEDLNHGASTRNNNNTVGRDPGPSPAFMNSSRPTTPGSSSQQQQQQQYQASSSGHSEHSGRRLSTGSQSSESGATGKSAVQSSTSAATSVASS